MPNAPGSAPRRLERALLPSLWCVFALMAGLDTVAHASTLLSVDGDPALHVLLGRIILARHALPPSDPTSVVTAGQSLVDHEWLSQVAFGAADRVLGLAGPVLLSAAVVAATLALAVGEARRRRVAPWTLLAVFAPAYLTMRVHLGVRPHLASWLLDLVVFLALDRARTEKLRWRRLTIFGAFLFALWANAHGGFLVGLGLIALFGASEVLRALGRRRTRRRAHLLRAGRVALTGAVCGLSTLINPYGWRLHAALTHFLGERLVFATTEDLAPPDFTRPETHLLLALMIGSFLLLAVGRRRAPAFHWLVLAALAALSLRSVRSASLFAPIAAVVVAPRLQSLLDRAAAGSRRWASLARAVADSNARLDKVDRAAGGALLAALVAVALIVAGGRGALPTRFDSTLQPVGAADFVQQHPARFQGQMYNAFHWGGYLAWRFYPHRLVYLHGFNFEYGPAPQREYLRIARASAGYDKALGQTRARWVIWPAGTHLAKALEAAPCWNRAYADPVAVLYLRIRNTRCTDGGR